MKVNGVLYRSLQQASLLWEPMPYVITQCYQPLGTGDIPTFIKSTEAGVVDLATLE